MASWSPLKILHTNDFHGKLDHARFQNLLELRAECDLYFDCGDAVAAGNIALPIGKDPVWHRLHELRCNAMVIGNRETNLSWSTMKAKVKGAKTPLLCLNFSAGQEQNVIGKTLRISIPKLKVLVIGLSVPMITERMAAKHITALRWTQPAAAARDFFDRETKDWDYCIALTHIGLSNDRQLAAKCPEIDLILGGHSHHHLERPEMVGKTAICQTGSHGRFAGIHTVSADSVETRLIPLN